MKINFDPVQSQGIAGSPQVKNVDGGFGEILGKAVAAVNEDKREAGALAAGLMAGEHSNIHETMIAMEKSSLSFRMLTKAQAKVIDAYKEIMRLQL